MDNLYFILQQMLYFTIPLLVVALGGMFSERSGVVNIALEGIMLIGAFFGILFINVIQTIIPANLLNNLASGQFILLMGLIVAGVSGILFSLLHSFASVNMKADQVISGTALNLFAPAAAIYIARSLTITNNTQQVGFNRGQFLIKEVPFISKIPLIGDVFFNKVYITTYIGILILIASYVILYKTRFGLRLRACGEHPHAAEAAGVNVYKIRYFGVGISGFLGGIGGFTFILTTSTEFNATVAGYGFLALAVLIFGQWKPLRILFAAIFFGLMKTIASAHGSIPLLRPFHIPSEFYKMIPFIATLLLLAFTSIKSQAPRAAGEIYDTGKR